MKKIDAYEANQQQGLLLNANENPQNIDTDILESILDDIKNIDFNRYPDNDVTMIREAYASYIGVDADQIMVGNGSDEVLGLLIHLRLGSNKTLYTLEYDFSMYDYYATLQDANIVRFPLKVEDTFDVDAFIQLGKKANPDLICFSNPNNPTGRCIEKEDLIKIVEAFADTYVIIDEAYAEFSDSSMIDQVDVYKNLLVTRTLSKAFGLAAIRCGMMIAHKETMETLQTYKVPYNVNTLTQVVATRVLQQKDRVQENIEQIKQARDTMYEDYGRDKPKNVTLYPSCANYFYGTSTNKEKLLQLMDDAQIIIRNFKDAYFRITVGSNEENKKVMDILRKV